MQRRRIAILAAAVGLTALVGVALFLLRPQPRPPTATITAETSTSVAAIRSDDGTDTIDTGADTIDPDPSSEVRDEAVGPPTKNTVANGVVFAFVNLAEPTSGGDAVLTIDVAEIRPSEENAPAQGANVITNPTVEAERVIASASALVDAASLGAGTMDLGTWLARRGSADQSAAALSRSPYWLEMQNGRVVRLRLQNLP